MGFSGQESWSGFSFPSPGDLPNPGIESESPALAARVFASELLTVVVIEPTDNIHLRENRHADF